jgi:hypothetical protein
LAGNTPVAEWRKLAVNSAHYDTPRVVDESTDPAIADPVVTDQDINDPVTAEIIAHSALLNT